MGFVGSLSLGSGCCYRDSGIFYFDSVRLYLCLLSGFLWVSLLFIFDKIRSLSKVVITFRVICSLISYCCTHALMFWVFYEMSILLLLLLLVVESPYSERYIAS